jgi:hypothetical protein
LRRRPRKARPQHRNHPPYRTVRNPRPRRPCNKARRHHLPVLLRLVRL